MALEIKHVADLMGKNFRIPSFQRGYRWERKQIEQLLDDLADFAESIEEAEIQDNDNNTWNNELVAANIETFKLPKKLIR